MATPYVGEIRMFAGTFAPAGWALCAGQQLPISQYEALFSLLGTTYGGDGQTTFNLPDLRSRAPVHQGQGTGLAAYTIGEAGGAEAVTLLSGQLGSHAHVAQGNSSNGTTASPAGQVWAAQLSVKQFSDVAPSGSTTMNAGAIAATGGGQPHDNMIPFQAINFIIALEGIYPSQS